MRVGDWDKEPPTRFRSLCPEAAARAAMTDDEFWAHVFAPWVSPMDPGYDWTHEVETGVLDGLDVAAPCAECGSSGACGYDDLGRPWIHALGFDR